VAERERAEHGQPTDPVEVEPRWGLGDFLIGLLAAIVLTAVFGPFVYWVTGVPSGTRFRDLPLRAVALLQVPFYAGMLGTALLVTWRKGLGPVHDLGLRLQVGDIPIGAAAGLLAQLAGNVLYLPLYWWTSISTDDVDKPARELTDKAHGAGVVLLILVVVVAAPIVEEIFYRGLLMRALERRIGTVAAVAASAAIFAAAHQEPLQFPPLFLFGLVAGWLAARYGRLGPSILAHLAFNSLAVVALLQRG
jgi:uncharacterized protein